MTLYNDSNKTVKENILSVDSGLGRLEFSAKPL
jgi:hypothetical protein